MDRLKSNSMSAVDFVNFAGTTFLLNGLLFCCFYGHNKVTGPAAAGVIIHVWWHFATKL